MKITIITISFNQVAFLKRAMDSVLDQGYNDLQYIVIDAGSTDGSRDVIMEYGDQVQAVFEPDKGQADGLNKGLSYAIGDVVGFVNSDDVLLPGSLKKVASYFKSQMGLDVLLGRGFKIDEHDFKIQAVYPDHFTLNKYAAMQFNFIQTATFFRNATIKGVGGFNIDNRTCWDGELLVDIALNRGKFIRVNDYLAAFRLYKTSISGSGTNTDKYLNDRKRIARKISESGSVPVFQKAPLLLRLMNIFESPIKLTLPFQRRYYKIRKVKCA